MNELEYSNIRLVNDLGTLELNLVDASPADPYQLRTVDGLGPPAVENAIVAGSYAGSEIQDRQVVVQLEFNPDWSLDQTVAQLRASLYSVLEGEIRVELVGELNAVAAYTAGRVSKFEIVPFQKEPLAQITIDCVDDPFLVAPEPTLVTGLPQDMFDIPNEGSASTGLYFEVEFTGSAAGWTLTNSTTNQFIELTRTFNTGEVLKIDTREGSRGVYVDDGTELDLIHVLTPESDWIQLRPGSNIFTVSSYSYDHVEASYTKRWWGI